MEKILLYYIFTPLDDPNAIRLWQRTLCEKYGLFGRIIVSPHGINGTVGGEIECLRRYVKETREYPAFKPIVFKWSEGSKNDFPRLSVKTRPELVALGYADQLKVDENGVVGGGKHLSPEQVNKLVKERGDVVFFDGRNVHEAKVGRFKDAVVPDVNTSHDFAEELKSSKYDSIKDKPVISYCTGGIRCEIISAMMKDNGFKEVYQIDGGIVKYGEKYGDNGLWEGSLRVFDGRMKIDFSDKAKIIGKCHYCRTPTNEYKDIDEQLLVVCPDCA